MWVISVTRQVLAEPEAGLPGKTWAALADGTPLITAAMWGFEAVLRWHHPVLGVCEPGHPMRLTVQPQVRTRALHLQIVLCMAGADGQDTRRHRQAGRQQQAGGQQGLGQRHRQPLVGAAPQGHHGIGKRQLGAALVSGHTGQGYTGLRQGLPQGGRPCPTLHLLVQ